jgi:hypothetical protein
MCRSFGGCQFGWPARTPSGVVHIGFTLGHDAAAAKSLIEGSGRLRIVMPL